MTNTYKLLDACNIEMDFTLDKNKSGYVGSKQADFILLEKLARAGLYRRYGRKNKVAISRLEKELKVIFDLGFITYFLINHDFIRFASEQGFYHVGRGSGANSIVAYCLGITNVDIEFSWTGRD